MVRAFCGLRSISMASSSTCTRSKPSHSNGISTGGGLGQLQIETARKATDSTVGPAAARLRRCSPGGEVASALDVAGECVLT